MDAHADHVIVCWEWKESSTCRVCTRRKDMSGIFSSSHRFNPVRVTPFVFTLISTSPFCCGPSTEGVMIEILFTYEMRSHVEP